MPIAITRRISPRFAECEITHIERTPINLTVARAQHKAYTEALASLGCQIIELPEEADLPDSVFVEDTAVILPEVAVITRPGADSRKPETESIIRALTPYRPFLHITEPATMDGGDILVVDKQIFVGMSSRSNVQAIKQLQELLDNHGYKVTGVDLHGCLHLKSAVTRVDDHTLLINKYWVDGNLFHSYEQIEVDPSESQASNCLPVGDSIIFPAAFPNTRKKLEKKGFNITSVDVTEIAKAEGAVTCCSLIIDE